MPARKVANRGEAAGPTTLDIFACSLIDRGLKTAYDLQREAGLSVGSTVPALARMERAGLVEKEIMSTGDRHRFTYHLSPAGRKLARTGWRLLLDNNESSGLEDVLRVIDMAIHYQAPLEQIRAFLERAARQRNTLARQAAKEQDQGKLGFEYSQAKIDFETVRLNAESRFLRSWIERLSPANQRDQRKRSQTVG